MKKILLALTCMIIVIICQSQLILFQDFAGGASAGWVTANGSSVGPFNDPANGCAADYGIITPGVGGNNPAKILSQVINPNQTIIEVKFWIGRFNSNLNCNTFSDFGCPTNVDILAVASTYNGTDPIGDGATIYSNNSGFALPISGGFVSLNFTLPNAVTPFKVFFNFSTPGNCNQGGTKYVMDKFSFTGLLPCQVANTCAPEANNDYFQSGPQGFSNTTALLANVYGTNLAWVPPPVHSTFITRSLTEPIVATIGGKDFDIEGTPLTNMSFALTGVQNFVNGVDGTLVFNSDGTFSFLQINTSKLIFSFNYRLTKISNGLFDDAIVRIDFGSGGPLPVILTDFNATKQGNNVWLTWSTSQEQDNKGFEILKKTGANFEKTAFVDSKAPGGNSASAIHYSFNDAGIKTDKNIYYRLKQVDLNGKELYSEIRVIRTIASGLLVYPNPSPGEINVVIPADLNSKNSLRVVNANGATVYSLNNTASNQVKIGGLKPGIYIVRVSDQETGSIQEQKFIVQ